MKKYLKENIKILITILITTIVVGSFTTVFAYSLIANNVSFTPKDSSWNVNNTKEALDNLNLRTNQLSTHFSLKEQIVGEWIDGKPVYQKTIEGLNVKMDWIGTQAYTVCTINAPIENVKRIINARAYMSSTSNGFINWSEIANINIVSENSTSWKINSLEDYYLRGLTIQYIKTTD